MTQKYQFVAVLTADRDMVPGMFSVGIDWLDVAFASFLHQSHYHTDVKVLSARLLNNDGDTLTRTTRLSDDTNESLVRRLDRQYAVSNGDYIASVSPTAAGGIEHVNISRPERVQAAFEVWQNAEGIGPSATAMFEYIVELEKAFAAAMAACDFHSQSPIQGRTADLP